jgi:hypothetical protein
MKNTNSSSKNMGYQEHKLTQVLKTWDIKNINSSSKGMSIKNINSSSKDMGYQEHKLKL